MYLMSELAPSHGKYPAGATLRVRPPLKHRLKKLAVFDATRKTVISKTLGLDLFHRSNLHNVFQQYQGHMHYASLCNGFFAKTQATIWETNSRMTQRL
jgi:hypothetical protein